MSEIDEIVLIRGALVRPPGQASANIGAPPLGLAYLAATLRDNGFACKIIDAPGESIDTYTKHDRYYVQGLTNHQILERISKTAKLIGVSCMFTHDWINIRPLIKGIRARFPSAVIVLGGEHATSMTDTIFKTCPAVDFIVRGEGEEPLLELVKNVLMKSGNYTSIPGLAWRQNGETMINPGNRIRDINAIPHPAWDALPINTYLDAGSAGVSSKERRIMPVLGSRGCPYDCAFCSNGQMWGQLYRMRDVDDLVAEIAEYKRRYNITGFEFHDLTLIVNRSWFLKFVKKLADAKLDLEWDIPNTRSEAIDSEVVDALVQSGCSGICMAPDTGSPRILKEMGKNCDLSHIENCVKNLVSRDFSIKINLILGSPNETHGDIWKTIYYGMRLGARGAQSVFFYRFVPYPGSQYYDLVMERDQIPSEPESTERFFVDNLYNDFTRTKSYAAGVSTGWLTIYMILSHGLSLLAHLCFNPKLVSGMVKRIVQRKPRTHLEAILAPRG